MEIKGVYTALVTPFSNGKVDYVKLEELVNKQIAGGVDGIVPVGTTGESPTLNTKEHIKVIEEVIRVANKRCIIMAGTGANSTDEAIELTLEAKKVGADCSLQVAPYYNKPSQEGLYRHFSKIVDDTGLPAVLYNVPGRCGVAIAPETVARLSRNSKIIAVKEASGNVERVSEILDLCDISVMSGDDALTIPMMSVGAKGIISVASNIIPAELKTMLALFNAGNMAEAMKMHMKYYRLFKDLFVESNPIPVKSAMAMLGMIEEEYRLPLCPPSEKSKEVIQKTLVKTGLL